MSLAASISHTQQLERAEAPQSVSISANSGGQAGLAEGFSQNEAASSSRRRRHGPAVMRGGTAGQPEQRHVMTRESRLLAKACVELLNEKKGPPAACLGIYNYGARLRRSSVAAATPSPLRRSSAPRTMIAGSCRPPPAGAPGHQISYHVHHHHIKCVTHSHPEKKIVFLLNELVG